MKRDPFAQREAQNYSNPIASREHILACLIEHDEPMGFKQLATALNHEQPEEREALQTRLRAMVRDGQLDVDRRNVFAIATNKDFPTGKISAHSDGYGFLIQEGDTEDIFLTLRQMRQVIHGDIAKVRVRGKDRRGRSEGEIVEVLERKTQQLVGRYYMENGQHLLEPLNNRINHEVLLNTGSTAKLPFKAGQIVVADIVEQPGKRGVVTAQVVEVLGDHLTPGIEVDIALRNHDIPIDFSDDVIEAVDGMPIDVRPSDKRNRFDLTELPFVTIDGEDARDFDDAVYCEKKDSGGWRLYVAIADVAHYVTNDSDLDQAASERGTSVYFPQYVVPMLPEKLSNGLCSLKPNVERLVLVCEMTISAKGTVSSYQFYEGVIHSHARLTYTQVARAIGDKSLTGNSDALQTRSELSNVVGQLDDLHDLYNVLIKVRHQRGAIDFDSAELQFQFAADGRVQGVVPRARNTAHRIIEECMLCANVSAARFVTRHKKPGLFRVHATPEPGKVEQLAEFLSRFDVPFSVGDELTPKDYQQVSERLRELKNGRVLQISLLRSMNQAVYSIENEGHFGLAYQEYTHFTSPIRRYPDLLTHRLIKSVIHSNNEDKTTLRLGSASKKNFYPYDKAQMVNLGVQTSYTERRAEAAVYEVLEWIKCDYVSDRVGDILEGVITGVTKFGFFVELNDIFVEGLVHISTLKGDYYQYDQGAQCLVGERTNEVYGMGDGVQAQISRVNVDERKIDFELVSHSPLARKAPTGKSFDKKPGRNRSKKSDVAKKTDSKRKRGKPDRRKKAEPQSNVTRTKAAKSKSSKPKSAASGAPKVAKEGASQNAAQGSAKAKKGKARKPKLSRGPKNTAGDKPKGR